MPTSKAMPQHEALVEQDDARAGVLVRLAVLFSQRGVRRAVSVAGRAVALGDGPSTALASRSRERYAQLPDWLPTQVFGPSAQHAGGGNTRVTTRGVETSADVYSRREVEDLGHVDAPCCRRRPVVEWCRCWCERGRRGWGTARTAGDAGDDGKEARAVGVLCIVPVELWLKAHSRARSVLCFCVPCVQNCTRCTH